MSGQCRLGAGLLLLLLIGVCYSPVRGQPEDERGMVEELTFSPDSSRLVVQTESSLFLFDTSDLDAPPLSVYDRFSHVGGAGALAYSPDGRWLAVGRITRVIFYDPQTLQERFRIEDLLGDVSALAFSPDGLQLYVGTQGRAIYIFSTSSLNGQAPGCTVTAARNANIRAMPSQEGYRVAGLTAGQSITVSLRFTGADGVTWYGWGDRRNLQWVSGTVAQTEPACADLPILIRALQEENVNLGFNNRFVVTPNSGLISFSYGGDPHTLWVWNPVTGEQVRAIRASISSTGGLVSIANQALFLSPDGTTVGALDGEGIIRFWPVMGGAASEWHFTFTQGQDFQRVMPWDAEFTADGSQILIGFWETSAARGHEHYVEIWDYPAQRAAYRLGTHDQPLTALAVSPNGRWAASGAWDGTVKVWDLTEKRLLGTLTGFAVGDF